jgi:CHASE2 domain-containing sensor protein
MNAKPGYLKSKRIINRRKEAIVVLSAIPLTLILGSIGLFRTLETPVLDFLTRARAGQHRNVIIVRIDDHNYKNKFSGKSPLDPKMLEDVLCAIAKGGPSVIGVDIDTSGPEFREFKPDPKCLEFKPWPPVVWARNAVYSNRHERYQVFDVLGNQDPPPLSGFVTLKLDPDETIRRYVRVTKADDGKAEFLAASFPWAIVRQLPNKSGALLENNEELLIKFQGEPKDTTGFNFDAETVLKVADGEGWRINGPLKGHIVLLGGDYTAQDEHKTPVGCMLGVEVMAQIIETEMAGGGITSPSAFLRVALAVFSTLLLVLILSYSKSYKRIVVCVLLIPLLAGLSSYAAFRSLSQFPTFALVLVIILGYILFQQIKEKMKRKKEMNTASH